MSNLKNEKEIDLQWDNSRYTKEIKNEQLNLYTNDFYEESAKRMDSILLHAVSEQRCRPFGCRLSNCLGRFNDMNACLILYRQMNYCVEKERRKVIYEFIQSGKQPLS